MLQSRLFSAFSLLQKSPATSPLLLVKCAENANYLCLMTEVLQNIRAASTTVFGGYYTPHAQAFRWQPASYADEQFATLGEIRYADWIEPEQLFGCVRINQQQIQLEPGLLHRVNGGTLVLSLHSVLTQPRMWFRLKQIFIQKRFDWLSPDETRPLTVSVPSMPMQFRLLLCGDWEALAAFQEMEPELASLCTYSEFEETLQVENQQNLAHWYQWVYQLNQRLKLPTIDTDFWPILLREGMRHTGEQYRLPLCPCWLERQLQEASLYSEQQSLRGENLTAALEDRAWRENSLSQSVHDDILSDQIFLATEGEAIGQINGLSVVEFPGHPRPFGEPSRISCVVHAGDGEFNDVEHKAELSGNVHAKGMMIMQAYLVTELQLDQQLPFSASLVFEQSYSEVDGDSASLAGFCAFVSALARRPIHQYMAVTGSVDQLGNVQSVGGINEKIEGFFAICHQRDLNGKQGVIIPASNVQHLCLQKSVIEAVRNARFHIWTVSRADEALLLLTDMEWSGEGTPSLLSSIQERIAQIHQQEVRQRLWLPRWFSGFKRS